MTRLLKPLWQPLFAACCALGVASPVSALTIAIDDSNLANYFTDSASTSVFPCPANIAGPGTLCLADPGLPAAANALLLTDPGVPGSSGPVLSDIIAVFNGLLVFIDVPPGNPPKFLADACTTGAFGLCVTESETGFLDVTGALYGNNPPQDLHIFARSVPEPATLGLLGLGLAGVGFARRKRKS